MTRPKEGGETISAQNIELTQLILHIPHARKLGLKLVDCAEDSLIVELPYSSQIEARPGNPGICSPKAGEQCGMMYLDPKGHKGNRRISACEARLGNWGFGARK